MSYATGSGDYNALMTAILSFAITDGWTEIGGGGTGYPITSPNGTVAAFDWDSETGIGTDYTEGGGGGDFDMRWLKWGIGADSAAAATMAQTSMGNPANDPLGFNQGLYPVTPNGGFDFLEWHIFSDPASGYDYIHVAARFANSAYSDVWTHISVGEVDRQGMLYSGIAYCSGLTRYGWAQDSGQNGNWNSMNETGWLMSGNVGRIDAGWSNTAYVIGGTSPVNDAAGYPAVDTPYVGGSLLWDNVSIGTNSDNITRYLQGTGGYRLGYGASVSLPMPFTGAVSLQPIVFAPCNGSRAVFCGVFPGARTASMLDYNPADEVTFGSETWQLFPLLRKTDESFLTQGGVVTSAMLGVAYKKVL